MTVLSAADAVTTEIRRRLWDGELSGGDRVPQDEIAERLDVSRIPVREALIGLEREGLVEITPRRGARVVALTEQAVCDHYELYGVIDAYALDKTLSRATSGDMDALRSAVDTVIASKNAVALQAAVADVRELLYRVGGSPRLTAVAAGLRGFVPGDYFTAVPGSEDVVRGAYQRLATALDANDHVGAREVYATMMSEQADCVIPVMKARGLLH